MEPRQSFSLHSPETTTDYRITVETPADLPPGVPAPVVLFMDGDDQFTFAVEAYRQLMNDALVTPLHLVGVGYGVGYGKPANRRGRDYTPVAHADEPSSGGADAFLRFLTTTLWTELTQRYAIDQTARGIAGHSLGSLLVLHALFQPRPFFTHHLASAPAIWWADRALLAHARAMRETQTTLPAKLFLSVGEDDSASMTGDLTLLERFLTETPFKELVVTSTRFPHRNHYNVIADAFCNGLLALFGGQRP